MASAYSITRSLDRFAEHAVGGQPAFSKDGDRVYLFDADGNVVSMKAKPDETTEETKFRLQAALGMLRARVNGDG